MEFINVIKRSLKAALRIFGVTVLLLTFFSLSILAQKVRRVKFVYGKTSVVLTGAVGVGSKDIYIIRLKKGQDLEIGIEWEGEDITNEPRPLSGYVVIDPKSANLPTGFLQPAASGDYKIIVSPLVSRTDYRYRIAFTRY
jgi:hypothetical protein